MTSNRFIYSILSAFIAGTLLLIFIQYNSSKNLQNLITGNNTLLEELRVANHLRELERNILSAESKLRGAVATGDSNYLQGMDAQITQTLQYLESLKKKSDNDSTSENLNKLSDLAEEKLVLKNLIIDSLRKSGMISPANFRTIMEDRTLREKKVSNEVNEVTRKIYNSRQQKLDSLELSISNSGRKARSWGTFLIILVLVSGAMLFWYIINRIRKQNHLIEELDASEKRVREASIIKENFMANMSHEIRTPMNAILGFTNLLKARNRNPELTQFVSSIHTSAENLLTIINDILDLSKIEAGMIRIESAPFSVRELVHSIQMMFAEKISEKRLEFYATIDQSIPQKVLGDATRLTQILVNMIGNAVKFTDRGTIQLEINNKRLQGNLIRLEFIIRDTGIGIVKEKLSGIFERFRQAEDSITRKYGGTGLGLSIVKELVMLQNGEIEVESTPGSGTSFRFIIPYEIVADQLTVPTAPESDDFDYRDFQNVHILAVEDNEMNQKLLRHLLSDWKLSFEIVNNGIEALESLQTSKFDLVLMDIQMPEMDGYTTAQEIRRKFNPDITIIAMTAHAFAGEREKCLTYGMNDYIAKPINEKELRRLIRAYTATTRAGEHLKKQFDDKHYTSYQVIKLEYMQSISDGNKEFEKTVTEQFIEAIPLDLETLESACTMKDVATIRKTAHEMKTNVSIMGLSEDLSSFLDELEYQPFDEARFQQIILSIKRICLNAIAEAQHFYSTF